MTNDEEGKRSESDLFELRAACSDAEWIEAPDASYEDGFPWVAELNNKNP